MISDCEDRWEKILSDLFGVWFNVAPLIMKAIVSPVLSQEAMGHSASAYIDNIHVNADVVPPTNVREHLAWFGLKSKDPERLEYVPSVIRR